MEAGVNLGTERVEGAACDASGSARFTLPWCRIVLMMCQPYIFYLRSRSDCGLETSSSPTAGGSTGFHHEHSITLATDYPSGRGGISSSGSSRGVDTRPT